MKEKFRKVLEIILMPMLIGTLVETGVVALALILFKPTRETKIRAILCSLFIVCLNLIVVAVDDIIDNGGIANLKQEGIKGISKRIYEWYFKN